MDTLACSLSERLAREKVFTGRNSHNVKGAKKAMKMQNSNDLFIHELSDMYDAEQRILQMLPTMAQECNNNDLKMAFKQHEQETRQQVLNLEQCFQQLGAQPDRSACYAIAGLKQEH